MQGAYPGMVEHSCQPSTQEMEAGGSIAQGQPGLHSKFKASLGCLRPGLETNEQTEEDK